MNVSVCRIVVLVVRVQQLAANISISATSCGYTAKYREYPQ